MYAKNIRPSAKREVQKERNAESDGRIARLRRAQICERSVRWECARKASRFSISFYANRDEFNRTQSEVGIFRIYSDWKFGLYQSELNLNRIEID